MSGELLMAGVPFKFEARNPYPKYTRLRSGDCYKLTIEISEDDWNTLKTMPSNALLDCWMLFTDGDPVGDEQAAEPVKPKKVKAEKGAWGAFWQILCKDGLFNSLDLQSAIEAELGVTELSDYEQGLRDVFQVTSRTCISPIDFEQFLGRYNLAGLITKLRQAAAKVQG